MGSVFESPVTPPADNDLTVWSEDWDPDGDRDRLPVAGEDFFVKESAFENKPHWLFFPKRDGFAEREDYQSMRHSWMLVEKY